MLIFTHLAQLLILYTVGDALVTKKSILSLVSGYTVSLLSTNKNHS